MLPVADVSDQAVLITGGGRGLGRAIALRLAQRGSRIGLIDLDAAGCNAVAEQIRTAGGHATSFTADVADQASVLGAAAEFAREHGGIDAIINISKTAFLQTAINQINIFTPQNIANELS